MGFPIFTQGTFLWFWYQSLTGLNAMTLALIVTGLVLLCSKWTPARSAIKAIVTTGFLATIPLGLVRLGFTIPNINAEVITYLNFLGAIVTLGVGIPYLFHQVLRVASGQHTNNAGKYEGRTISSETANDLVGTTEYTNETLQMSPERGHIPATNVGAATSAATIAIVGTAQPAESPERKTVIKRAKPALAWLAVTGGPDAGQVVNLGDGTARIGRGTENDLTLNDPYVSRSHAMVRLENGVAYLTALGRDGNTEVNGRPVTANVLQSGSVITVGETKLALLEIDSSPNQPNDGRTLVLGKQSTILVVKTGVDSGKTYNISEGDNVIGRGADCRIQLSDDTVSRQHAVIRCRNGRMTVTNLSSASGTRVDGRQVGGNLLQGGDVIRMGKSEVTLMAPQMQPVAV